MNKEEREAKRAAVFWKYVHNAGECWYWGSLRSTYSVQGVGMVPRLAAFVISRNQDVGREFTVKTKCGDAACLRPSHLVKVRKGGPLPPRQYCIEGHELTDDNVHIKTIYRADYDKYYQSRRCLKCMKEEWKAQGARARARRRLANKNGGQ